MAIKPQPAWRRQLSAILIWGSTIFLLVNLFVPQLFAPRIPQVPYSLFIDQVEDGKVQSVYVAQNEIRYQLKPDSTASTNLDAQNKPQVMGQVLSTTPIFDLELPKRLEEKGIEFAAAPPPRNSWIGTALSWIIPPLIFVGIWQFFLNRGNGGALPVLYRLRKVKPRFMWKEKRKKSPFKMWREWKKPRLNYQKLLSF